METHIAEIKVDGTQLIPFLRIPTNDEGSADTPADPHFTERHALWAAGDSNPEPMD